MNGTIGLITGLALMFIGFFIKSPLIKIAIFLCMISVLMEPMFKDTWFQAAAVIIMIWSLIAAFLRLDEKGVF